MITRNLILVKRKVQASWYSIKPKIGNYSLRFAVLGLLSVAIWQEQIHLNVSIGIPALYASATPLWATENIKTKSLKADEKAGISSLFWWEDIREKGSADALNLANEATATSAALTPEQQALAANYSNLGFVLNPAAAEKKGIDPNIVLHKQQKCANYIKQYLNTSKEEAKLYNIPIAITLAQGLLESNAGDSKLAKKENNHFGIKCNGKSSGNKCANYTDDSPADMFRVFESPWYSFREHSKLLQQKRYKHLLQLPRTDYRNWAYGLKAAGYATDKKYAEKLIKIIEVLQLYKYDEM